MPDEDITVEPHGSGQTVIPTWLSPNDQQQLREDLDLPKGSKEHKAAAKKWKKKVNDLKKAAAAATAAAGQAKTPEAKNDAEGVAETAQLHANDLEGTVLNGFGGTIRITKVLLPGIGIAVIVAVVVILAAGGGGGGGKHPGGGGGNKGSDKGSSQEKKAPKKSIQWTEKVVGTNTDAACHAATTVEFTIIDGTQYAGQTAVVSMTGTENQTQNVAVGAGGTLQATFNHTLQPAGPGTCQDTETYSLASVGGDDNVAIGQAPG